MSLRSLPIYEAPEQAGLRTWTQLARTFLRFQRRLSQELAQHGLTLPQFDVLATLHYTEGLTQQELAEWLLVTKGNVCGVLDRLQKSGWVERRPDERDARANRLYLTPEGRSKIELVLPEHDRAVLNTVQPLGRSQAQLLRGLLEQLESGLIDD